MEKKEIIDGFLTKALDYLESAESMAREHIPAYIEEVLTFRVYAESVDLLWGLALLLLGTVMLYLIFIKKGKKGNTQFNTDEEGAMFVGFFMGVLPFVIGLLMMVSATLDIIQIHVAPRMYMIEYLKTL